MQILLRMEMGKGWLKSNVENADTKTSQKEAGATKGT